jgi:carbonic anhydrase
VEIRDRTKVLIRAVGAGLCLLAAASPAGAANISGRVINQAIGQGMAGITVSLYDPAGDAIGNPTTTDAGGNYSFSGLSSGNYLIQENAPSGMYQVNSTFPNYAPTPQSTPGTYGGSGGDWDYTGGGGTVPPQGWIINGTPAPFESAVTLSGPTVNLGQFVQENFTNTSNFSLKLQSSVPGDPGYQIQATSFGVPESVTLNGTTFNLANIHYHDPAENQAGLPQVKMEEHFVLQSPVVNGVGGGEVVLAVFLQLGNTPNPTFDRLFGALTGLGHTGGDTLAASAVGAINFADLLPANMQGWFYPGSLTTPPLSTPVSWFVFSTPIEVDQQELSEYEAYASQVGFLDNARPVQALAGRTFNDLTSVTLGATDLSGVNIINAAVPEPTSLVMMGTAGLFLLGLSRRARRSSS